jgi:hypothetical protein
MSATESAPVKTLDVAYVSQVVRALLNEAGRQILVEDGPRQDLVPHSRLPPQRTVFCRSSWSLPRRSGGTSRAGVSN